MKRLQKESLKIKDNLSSNRLADVKIPELFDYVTLRTQLERGEFEARSAHILAKVQLPVTLALERAGLSISEIDQVEILGGGLRVPRVSELIREVTNKELHVHLNGDEAMCLGASFIASNFSNQFKVRQLYLTHRSQHDFKIKIEPMSAEGLTKPDADDENADNSYWRESNLFNKQTDYLGAKKTINLSYDRNMKIEIYQTRDGEDVLLTTYVLDNIDELASSEAASKEDTTGLKVSLSFELTRSYLL